MQITDSKYQQELVTAMRAARKAGNIMDSYTGNIGIEDTKTGETDIVTQADTRTQQTIRQILEEEFPKDGLYGEEGLQKDGKSGRKWVIDPIDGTFNFQRGHKYFCTSIALVKNNTPIVGVVLSPERGLNEMFYAVKNNGAYMRKQNGTSQLSTSNQQTLEGSLVETTFIVRTSDYRWESLKNVRNIFRARDIRPMKQGCLALSGCKVAQGVFDGALHYGWPWDFAASRLIINEATGQTRYSATPDNNLHELVAANKHLFTDLKQLLDNNKPEQS